MGSIDSGVSGFCGGHVTVSAEAIHTQLRRCVAPHPETIGSGTATIADLKGSIWASTDTVYRAPVLY